MNEQLVLPRIYEPVLEKYEKYRGLPKLSYSQITSYKDPLYKNQYILGYMFGIRDEGNVWATYGSHCGDYISSNGKDRGDMLSDADCEILDNSPKFVNPTYEDEICIDRGTYCIQGFSDIESTPSPGKVIIVDNKTGAEKTKVAFYGGPEYMQTKMYAYHREQEGFEIEDCYVLLYARLGNGYKSHPIRLSGNIIPIPTPYVKEEVEIFLEKVDVIAKEISDMYKVFLKVNT